MLKNYPLFINGQWLEKKETYEIINPFNGEVAALLSKPDKSDVEAAVVSAEKGFHRMKNLHTYERFDILEKTGDILKRDSKDIAHYISLEAGKPASSSARTRKYAVIEPFIDGLKTTLFPAAIAGAILWAGRLTGKLKGVIAAIMPTGTLK